MANAKRRRHDWKHPQALRPWEGIVAYRDANGEMVIVVKNISTHRAIGAARQK